MTVHHSSKWEKQFAQISMCVKRPREWEHSALGDFPLFIHACVPSYFSHVQSCPTLCDPMDCSPPGSSVYEIFQARILEWVATHSSRESSWPRNQTRISMSPALAGRFLTTSATWKAQDHHTSSLICLTQVNLDAESAVFKKEGSGIK